MIFRETVVILKCKYYFKNNLTPLCTVQLTSMSVVVAAAQGFWISILRSISGCVSPLRSSCLSQLMDLVKDHRFTRKVWRKKVSTTAPYSPGICGVKKKCFIIWESRLLSYSNVCRCDSSPWHSKMYMRRQIQGGQCLFWDCNPSKIEAERRFIIEQ